MKFDTTVIKDATGWITTDGAAEALRKMDEAGISIIQSEDLNQSLGVCSAVMTLVSSKTVLVVTGLHLCSSVYKILNFY